MSPQERNKEYYDNLEKQRRKDKNAKDRILARPPKSKKQRYEESRGIGNVKPHHARFARGGKADGNARGRGNPRGR